MRKCFVLKKIAFVWQVSYWGACSYAKAASIYDNKLVVDHHFSPYVSAAALSLGRSMLDRGMAYIPQDQIGSRYLFLLGNNLLNNVAMVTNHEAFGHGFYIRGFKGKQNFRENVVGLSEFKLYLFTFPPVFIGLALVSPISSLVSGCVCFASNCLDEEILVINGGNEANQILAEELLLLNLSQHSWSPSLYILYLHALSNLPGYLIKGNGDISLYQSAVRAKYTVSPADEVLQIQGWALWLMNPMFYTAVASYYLYLFKGVKKYPLPVCRYKGWSYIPTVHLTLTPFGTGWTFNHFLHHRAWGNFQVGMLGGKELGTGQYFGSLSLKTHSLWAPSDRIQLDLWARVWYQPSLDLADNSPAADRKQELGGLLGVMGCVWVHKGLGFYFMGAVKHRGFVPGVVPTGGYFFQVGAVFH